MKDFWKGGIIVLLIIGALYIIFLRECKSSKPCIADNEMIIKKSVWDSIQKLANKPAEVRIDTVRIVLPARVIVKTVPIPIQDLKDTTINNYKDSLVNEDIRVWFDCSVKGKILTTGWLYEPVVTTITKETIKYVPKIVDNPINMPKNGLYLYVTGGVNSSNVILGGGIDFITKKDTEIGYLYQRYGTMNFHSLKLGFKLKLGK